MSEPEPQKPAEFDAAACWHRLMAWALLAMTMVAFYQSSSIFGPANLAPPRPLGLLVNINQADQREVRLIPGIGPKLAERIIRDRASNGDYAQVADLDRVPGIGKKTLEVLSKYCCVQPNPPHSRALPTHSTIGRVDRRTASR